MTANIGGRTGRVIVNGKDYSAGIQSIEWTGSALAQTGLITSQCRFTILPVPGLPGVLRDRGDNADWNQGTLVTIDAANSAGGFVRHPRGHQRILSTSYDPDRRSITVNCGCEISALNIRQPTDPKDSEIEPPEVSARAAIVTALLNKAGITNLSIPGLSNPLNYRLKINGGYLKTVGELLYSARAIGWMTGQGQFKVKLLTLTPAATLIVTIGQDEAYWGELRDPEAPREIIKVVGETQIVRPRPTVQVDFYELRGDGAVVDYPGYNLVLFERTTTRTWDDETQTFSEEIRERKPWKLTIPDNFPTSQRAFLIESRREATTYSYLDTPSGELDHVRLEEQQPKGAVLAEYYKVKKLTPANTQLPIPSRLETITYSYSKSGLASIDTLRREPEATILAQRLKLFTSEPTTLYPSYHQLQSWNELRKGEWEENTLTETAWIGILSAIPDDIKALPTSQGNERLRALVTDPKQTGRKLSSSGQTTPNASERRPPKATFEVKQVEGIAKLAQYGGNPWVEKERTFTAPYLEGLVSTEGSDDVSLIDDGPEKQCRLLAEWEGAMLHGRFKGYELQLPLLDKLLTDWEPLMPALVIEPDTGKTRTVLLDADHWRMTPERATCQFDCIWLGDAAGYSGPAGGPYTITQIDRPYIIQSDIEGGEGEGGVIEMVVTALLDCILGDGEGGEIEAM